MTLLAYDVDLAALEESMSKDAGGAAGSAEAGGGDGTMMVTPEGTPAFVAALLHPAHRQSTAAQVNAAILTSQSHGPVPKLPNLLRMLAWGESLLKEKADFPGLEMQVRPLLPPPSAPQQKNEDNSSSTADNASTTTTTNNNNNNDVAMAA